MGHHESGNQELLSSEEEVLRREVDLKELCIITAERIRQGRETRETSALAREQLRTLRELRSYPRWA